MAVCCDIIYNYSWGENVFVSVVNFSIGGLVRHGFNLRPFFLGGSRVRSGEAGKVHNRVRGGECEVNDIIV